MLVHLNGQLVPHDRAAVSVFDRGFIFGDGLYEGLRAITDPRTGRMRVIGLEAHARRLRRGLIETRIEWDSSRLGPLTAELLEASGLKDAFVYWQITRGTPDLSRGPARSRVPGAGERPTVFGYASAMAPLSLVSPEPGVKRASLQPDLRWMRGTLKSTSLLGNVLAAMGAADHQADEAILFRETPGGVLVTEGTYTNVVIVNQSGAVVTPALADAPLLSGVTREILLAHEPTIREGRVTLADVKSAREVLLIGTTTMVSAVTRLDGAPVGDGCPGPEARRLAARLAEIIAAGDDERLLAR